MSTRSILCAATCIASLMILVTSGCRASSTSKNVAGANAMRAECLVCKSEGDLACVDVAVLPDTPSTQYRGTTYYFCSDPCRRDFETHPEKYLGK